MDAVEEFELRVSVAADAAKNSGFTQTYLALLEVLRLSRQKNVADPSSANTMLEPSTN